MARIVYPEAKYIKEIVDVLGKLVDEVAFQLTPDALVVKAIDPAKVALIDIYIPQTAFLEYDVSEEETAGLSASSLSKLLKKVKKGDRFVMNTTEDRVEIIIESVSKRIYRFRNLEIPLPEIPEAQLEFNVEAQLLIDVIKQAIKDAEAVGDYLEIEAPNNETLYLRGKGATVAETKLVSGMPALLSLEVKEPSKSTYQLEYLKYVAGLTKIAELANLRFSSDAPLELEFSLGEGRVKYLLAPAAL
ncbi:MAG: DNA polymerase sliding clamp [Desulfurococcales archaeon ex4484_58]|nr:MAG: DNA polymerase sliding clamp [Desulfurococcales archaeon ex4484_58]